MNPLSAIFSLHPKIVDNDPDLMARIESMEAVSPEACLHHPELELLSNFLRLDKVLDICVIAYMYDIYLSGEKTKILELQNDFKLKSLERKKNVKDVFKSLTNQNYLLRYSELRNSYYFVLNQDVVDAIDSNDSKLLPKNSEIETWAELMRHLNNAMVQSANSNCVCSNFWAFIDNVRAKSSKFEFWNRLLDFDAEERCFLIIMLHGYHFSSNLTDLLIYDYSVLIEKSKLYDTQCLVDRFESIRLYQAGYISKPGFLFDVESDKIANFELTELGKKLMFGDEIVAPVVSLDIHKSYLAIDPSVIKSVELLYNPEVQEVVNQLYTILEDKNLTDFFAKMEAKPSMPQNISILLHGPAGTGKTELSMQLAKSSNRQIMQIDLSKIRSKWVGDSEKNVVKIFTSYKEVANSLRKYPILLLNEADGLLSNRMEVNHSVDQMNNTMQNILLEQLEKFRGIVIATTNLKKNFDPAFDRRFIFKLELDTPTKEVQQKIWSILYPEIDIQWIEKLSEEFVLTGGQIKNITYRCYLGECLGKKVTLDFIRDACQLESPRSKSIGFGKS